MEIFDLFTIAYLISAIIGVVFSIRFWKTMTRIKEIRDHFVNQDLKNKPALPKYEVQISSAIDESQIKSMESKLKANQCIVQVNKTQKLEIWNKSDWDDVVNAGRENMFLLLRKNF